MIVMTKEIKHFYQHFYLVLATDYYIYMRDEFLKYIGMYYNSLNIVIMLTY